MIARYAGGCNVSLLGMLFCGFFLACNSLLPAKVVLRLFEIHIERLNASNSCTLVGTSPRKP